MRSEEPIQAGGGISRREVRSILIGVLLTMFLAALDQTIVAPALPTIARDLGQFDAISWVVTAYLLSATAATPILGKLSDLYGRRRLMMAGTGIFMLGSICCALAPSMVLLICARALQGAGGGALISLANTVVADVISPRERGRYQGYFASVYALASIAGPVMGGFFAEYASWTLIFWINLPLGALAIYMTDRALAHIPVKGRAHSIDYLGSLLMVAATGSLLLALTWGGHRYAWVSPQIIGLILLSALLTILFLRQQTIAREPVLPLSLLRDPVVRMAAAVMLLIMMVYVGATVYVPLFLELNLGLDANQSGLVLIAPMIGIVGGALISGQYMRFIGRYKLPPIVGGVFAVLALWMLGAGVGNLRVWEIVVWLGALGIGLGTSFPAMMVATQNAVRPSDLGIATASHAFFRSLGGAAGVSMFGAIILGVLASHVTPLVGDALVHNGDINELLVPGPARQAAAPYLGQAFALFFKSAAVITGLALIGLVRLKEIPLRQKAAAEMPAE